MDAAKNLGSLLIAYGAHLLGFPVEFFLFRRGRLKFGPEFPAMKIKTGGQNHGPESECRRSHRKDELPVGLAQSSGQDNQSCRSDKRPYYVSNLKHVFIKIQEWRYVSVYHICRNLVIRQKPGQWGSLNFAPVESRRSLCDTRFVMMADKHMPKPATRGPYKKSAA